MKQLESFQKELVTLHDAAKILGLSYLRTYQIVVQRKQIPSIRANNWVVLMRRQDVETLRRKREKNPPKVGRPSEAVKVA